MSRNAVKRLYLMQVGSMPEYQIPIVCYLAQTEDGKNILIDSGLPQNIPEDFSGSIIWMRRTTRVLLPFDLSGISPWDAFGWWMGKWNFCRGWS